jgi:hypothetical protein
MLIAGTDPDGGGVPPWTTSSGAPLRHRVAGEACGGSLSHRLFVAEERKQIRNTNQEIQRWRTIFSRFRGKATVASSLRQGQVVEVTGSRLAPTVSRKPRGTCHSIVCLDAACDGRTGARWIADHI